METIYSVYILSNSNNTTVYVGVTNDLVRRVYEHKMHLIPGCFTERYNVTKLVYFECVGEIYSALEREKQLKSWSRKKKDKLIQSMNPDWMELYNTILE